MKGLMEFLERKLMPIAAKVGGQRHMKAMRDGMALSIPILIAGSIFLVFCNLPFGTQERPWKMILAEKLGQNFVDSIVAAATGTFWLVAVVSCIGIAYYLAKSYKVPELPCAIIALACFFVVTPQDSGWGVSFGHMGAGGLFVGIIVAFFFTEIYRITMQKNLTIRMPETVPPAVSKSFAALIPGIICVFFAFGINLLFKCTSFGNIHQFITKVLSEPLAGISNTLPFAILVIFLIHLLWIFGLHGAMIIGGILEPVWLNLMSQNLEAFNAGTAVPNILTKQFFDVCIYMGGSGATLALVVLMIAKGRSKQVKTIGKSTIGSSLFNINEPVIFGSPIVMNPLLAIPFILTPIILVIVSYFAMSTGLVAKPAGVFLHWTTPPIIGGYFAMGCKISGAVLQVVNFIIALFIYYPFFKMWDKQCLKEESGETSVTSGEVNVKM